MEPRTFQATHQSPFVVSVRSKRRPKLLRDVKPEESAWHAFWCRLSLALGWTILLCGAITALVTALIVYRTYTPVLYWDQWDLVNFLSINGGHLSLGELWARHNEHRIPWAKLAAYFDLSFFGGRNISLLCEIYIVRMLESIFLIWMCWRYGSLGKPQLLTAAGFIVFCTFYPIQIVNFNWGFQIAFVCLPFAASLAIGTAIIHADLVSTMQFPPSWSWALIASFAAAIVAETSLASGVLIWPFLLLVSWLYKMPRKTKVLIACLGVVAVAIFFWSYGGTDLVALVNQAGGVSVANPFESLRHPITLLAYVGTYLGWSWDTTLPTATLLPTFSQLVSASAVVGVVVGLSRVLFFGVGAGKLRVFLLVYMAFLLVTSVVTALGRINYGVGQAASSRYQSIALDFWACLSVVLLHWRSRTGSPARNVEIQVILLMLILGAVPQFMLSASDAKMRQLSLAAGWELVRSDPATAAGKLYPVPIPAAYDYLKTHGLGPDLDVPILGSIGPIGSGGLETLQVKGFKMLPAGQCEGYLGSVTRIPGNPSVVTAEGWAWNSSSATRPTRVLLASEDGAVVATADVSILRPDVRDRIPYIKDLETGWAVETAIRPKATLRAFAVSNDSTSVCPLTNEFRFR